MWNLFSKKKKSNKMDHTAIDDGKVETYGDVDYQWIKGDQIGMTEFYVKEYEQGGEKFIQFESGNRINIRVLYEFMIPVDKTISRISTDPEPTPIPTVNRVNISNKRTNPVKEIAEPPIFSLLKKQKPNMVDVNINISINLPTKELYDILTTSFENADEEIVQYVLRDVNLDAIKESLRNSILDIYK